MIGPVSALSSALQGMRVSSRQAEQAASEIASFGLESSEAIAAPDTSRVAEAPQVGSQDSAGADLADAMAKLIVAQHAYAAQARVVKTATEMMDAAIAMDRRGG